MVLSDLSKGDGSRTVAVGLLDASGSRGRFASGLERKFQNKRAVNRNIEEEGQSEQRTKQKNKRLLMLLFSSMKSRFSRVQFWQLSMSPRSERFRVFLTLVASCKVGSQDDSIDRRNHSVFSANVTERTVQFC